MLGLDARLLCIISERGYRVFGGTFDTRSHTPSTLHKTRKPIPFVENTISITHGTCHSVLPLRNNSRPAVLARCTRSCWRTSWHQRFPSCPPSRASNSWPKCDASAPCSARRTRARSFARRAAQNHGVTVGQVSRQNSSETPPSGRRWTRRGEYQNAAWWALNRCA